jgi:hypothetical protein
LLGVPELQQRMDVAAAAGVSKPIPTAFIRNGRT